MANKKVTQFNEETELGDEDYIHIVKGGNSRKIKAENFFQSTLVSGALVIAGFVKGNTSVGNHTVVLPFASLNASKLYIVKADDLAAGEVIVQGNGAEKIDDQDEITINSPYGVLLLYSDGTNWWII